MTHLSSGEDVSCEYMAAKWCTRVCTSDLSSSEWAEFEAWMSQDATHAAAFQRGMVVWQELSLIAEKPEIIAQRAEVLAAMTRANRLRWVRPHRSHWDWALATAASLMLVVASSAYMLSSKIVAYQADASVGRDVRLEDGSHIYLAPGSRVAVDLAKQGRAVTLLSGSAEFDVANRNRVPFVISSGSRTLVATDGGNFNVALLDREVTFGARTGRAAVFTNNGGFGGFDSSMSVNVAEISTGAKYIYAMSPNEIRRVLAADATLWLWHDA